MKARNLSLIVASLTAAVIAQGGQTWHVAVVLRRSLILKLNFTIHAVTVLVYAQSCLLAAVSSWNSTRS
jgi:hypothetical protein